MFKNKSKVAKFSNGLLIAIFVLALISCLSMLPQLISGNVTVIEGYTINDYWKDEILMICYVIFSGLTLLILNKKINLYKDEYTISRQVFNLLFVLLMLSSVLMISNVVVEYIINKKFSLYALLTILLSYVPVYIYSYWYVDKYEILTSEKSTRENVTNFIIIYLLTNYSSSVIELIINLILKVNDTMVVIQNLIVSFLWIFVILLANKLLNKDNSTKEVKVIKKKKKNK